MKHRWLLGLLFVVVLTAAACTPGEGDAATETSTPGAADFFDDY